MKRCAQRRLHGTSISMETERVHRYWNRKSPLLGSGDQKVAKHCKKSAYPRILRARRIHYYNPAALTLSRTSSLFMEPDVRRTWLKSESRVRNLGIASSNCIGLSPSFQSRRTTFYRDNNLVIYYRNCEPLFDAGFAYLYLLGGLPARCIMFSGRPTS